MHDTTDFVVKFNCGVF